jgi:threonine/homoserine/homoserine lactone efflux protein
MLSALLFGISYGFTAGISPGPMLGLVIAQTLQRGWRAGNLVALAPLISDAPIILLATLLISRLPTGALGWLGIVGGLFVIYLSVETLRSARAVRRGGAEETTTPDIAAKGSSGAVLWRAVATNFLNPHPYLFWGAVGAQLLVRTLASSGAGGAAVLLVSFYALLVGAKLLVALLVNQSRAWLHGRAYQILLFASALLLLALAAWLIFEGISTLFGT